MNDIDKYPFIYQKVKKLPKISNGTRFYSADTSNTNLFIARSQYYDTLIHQLPEGFISIYHTNFCERIFSASVLDSQRWYLITILRFGDGIEMRPSYRSIFVAIPNSKLITPYISDISKVIKIQNSTNHDEYTKFDKWNTDIERIFLNSVNYPVSSRTYFPQCVSWTYFNSSLFMFTTFDNIIHTLEVAYDKVSAAYKITPGSILKGYSFHSVLFSNTPHVYLIYSSTQKSRPPPLNLPQCASPNVNAQKKSNNHDCASPVLVDRTKSDIPVKYKLPDEIKISPNTEFHIFISPFRRKITSQINENRCIVIANLDDISIVFPSSGYFLKIPYNYQIDEYIELSKKSIKNIKININPEISKENDTNYDCVGYSMEEAYFRPASLMPLYSFENDLLLIAAPRDFITAVLIDQDDRIRASFMVPTIEPEKVISSKTSNSDSNNDDNNNNSNNDDNNKKINNDNDNDSGTNNNNNNNKNTDNEKDGNNTGKNAKKRNDKDDIILIEKLDNLFSLNDKASRVLNEITGEIFKANLNASFFVKKDPRFVIPILHYFIRPRKSVDSLTNSYIIENKIDSSIVQLVTEDSLQTFWNCEIFNEILLLQFNASTSSASFRERVCSTFARSHIYKQWVSLFVPYENMRFESKSKNNSNKMNVTPLIKSRTPDHGTFNKMRSNSMIYDIESSSSSNSCNNNNEISKKKPPLSPIISQRSPISVKISRPFLNKSDNETTDNNNDNDDIDDEIVDDFVEDDNNYEDDDDDDEVSVDADNILSVPHNLRTAVTPRAMQKKGSFYPSSLPRNRTSTTSVAAPSQPLSFIYQDEEVGHLASSKVPLSNFVSTPISNSIEDVESKKLNVFPIFNFRDIESKASKFALETLQLNDMQSFYRNILKIFNESIFFDLFKYSETIRFPCYLQFIAIKMSLSEKPFFNSILVKEKIFRENSSVSASVKDFWSSARLLPHDIRWPEWTFSFESKSQANRNEGGSADQGLNNLDKNKNSYKLRRQWWYLRSKKCAMVLEEISNPNENLFNFVEQVTRKSENKGFEFFQLHQNMLGRSLYQTVSKPSK